jgi:hypothetical protein
MILFSWLVAAVLVAGAGLLGEWERLIGASVGLCSLAESSV